MKFDFRTDVPAADAYFQLFQTTGWNEKYRATAADLAQALENSWYMITAYDGEDLVGFGRILCDGVLHAMIFDLIVDPAYQQQGIGSQILEMLITKCRDANITDIQLFSALNKQDFYEKRGFVTRPADAPGMEYVWEVN